MKRWQCVLLTLACLATSGCRSDPAVAFLEQELRHQEDEIYRLQRRVSQCKQQMAIQAENVYEASSGHGLAEGMGIELAVPTVTLPAPIGSATPPTASRENDATIIESRDVTVEENATTDEDRGGQAPAWQPEPGRVELLIPSATEMPNGETPPLRPFPGGLEDLEMPSTEIPPGRPSLEGPLPGRADKTSAIVPWRPSKVVALRLVAQQCGGCDTDGQPGEDGIRVAFVLLDARGMVVEVASDVAIVLLDPAMAGDAARIARWDFSEAEVAGRFCDTEAGRGLVFEMDWPAGRPINEKLHLFVRYTADDGRRLEVDRTLRIGRSDWAPTELQEPGRLPSAVRIRLPHGRSHGSEEGQTANEEPNAEELRMREPAAEGPMLRHPRWAPERPSAYRDRRESRGGKRRQLGEMHR